ncbi:MAG: glycerol-3-phosphate 1-O-acyltransferase PlsY [Oscillospiraceae bacterium]|nr:glycerol-3-phosphate 1-O-acyltransferase PlsY [Oscillospiraceae bacterium]
MIIELLLPIVFGYLLGSVPFALVIGKVFYKTDIRQHGSKNLGGGNAGRVLGKKAGLAVMTLDILKVSLAVFLASFFPHRELTMTIAGLAAAVGHCLPLFARFRGGKAVAVMYGYLFGMMLCRPCSPLVFFLPLITFLVILYLTKIIALSSIGSAVAVTVYTALAVGSPVMTAALVIFSVMIVWRHRSNLARIRKGEENKISWM